MELLLPDESAQRHAHLRQGYLADPRPRAMGSDLGLSVRRRDGSTFPVEIGLTPLPTDDGPWILASVVDITARCAAEARVRTLSDAHLALAELNAAILHAHSPEELYDAACRVVTRASDELGAWVAQSSATGALEVVAHVGETGPVADQTGIMTDLPRLTEVLTEGTLWLCTDVAAETSGSWRTWALGAGVATVVGLALRRAGRPVAVLVVHSARPDLAEGPFVSVLETMADNLSFALDRLATQERMQRIDAQRLELLAGLVAAQEQERSRIASDVHDHSIQALAALDLRLGMHRRQLDQVAPDLVPSVDALHAGLLEVVAELRHLLFDLEVADEGVPLVDQLRDALEHVFESSDTVHTIDVRDPARADLPPDQRVQAVRIFKEALSNVRRHAHASTVRVVVTPDDRGVEVVVDDDGVGPPADAATVRSARGHRGLDGMHDRAAVAGGWCTFERVDGHTVLRFWLPRAGSEGARVRAARSEAPRGLVSRH